MYFMVKRETHMVINTYLCSVPIDINSKLLRQFPYCIMSISRWNAILDCTNFGYARNISLNTFVLKKTNHFKTEILTNTR